MQNPATGQGPAFGRSYDPGQLRQLFRKCTYPSITEEVMKHKILMSVLLVGLSGCMKVAKKDAENKVAPQVVLTEEPEEKNTRSRSELSYSYDVDRKANLKSSK